MSFAVAEVAELLWANLRAEAVRHPVRYDETMTLADRLERSVSSGIGSRAERRTREMVGDVAWRSFVSARAEAFRMPRRSSLKLPPLPSEEALLAGFRSLLDLCMPDDPAQDEPLF